MKSKIILQALLFAVLVLSASGEDVLVDNPQAFELVAAEDLRSLTSVTRGEETWIMHMGPTWFWESEELRFLRGDTLVVFGETVVTDGVMQLYPYKLIHGDVEVRLATEEGIPLWTRGFRGRSAGDTRGHGGHGHGNRGGNAHHWGR